MKRFLFMYTSFGGHVLEYFIHIYHYAIDDEKNTYTAVQRKYLRHDLN